MTNHRLREIDKDQRGMASFFITIIMTIVITLIVIGFSQIAHNEQVAEVNRDLSTQAFYAAESGVNDAINAIQTYLAADNGGAATIPSKTICGDTDTSADPTVALDYPTLNGTVDSTLGVSYPCIIISANPTSLIYTGTTSKVVNIQNEGNASISTITLNWQNNASSNDFAGCVIPQPGVEFPTAWPAACGADVLQVDLFPAVDIASGNPINNLESGTFTTFLYPAPSGSADEVTDNTATSNGVVQSASCVANSGCTAVISVLSLAETQYYLRFNAMYGTPQNVTITATDSNGNTVAFTNGQAVIDSTGIANEVLRRIEIRTPLNNLNDGLFPNAAIQSTQTICKQFWVAPSLFTNENCTTSGA